MNSSVVRVADGPGRAAPAGRETQQRRPRTSGRQRPDAAETSSSATSSISAGNDEHEERKELVLPEAARLLDAPGIVHGRADRAEDAQRAPDERERADDAEA